MNKLNRDILNIIGKYLLPNKDEIKNIKKEMLIKLLFITRNIKKCLDLNQYYYKFYYKRCSNFNNKHITCFNYTDYLLWTTNFNDKHITCFDCADYLLWTII